MRKYLVGIVLAVMLPALGWARDQYSYSFSGKGAGSAEGSDPVTEEVVWACAITPTQLSGDVDDYTPTGIETACALRIDGGGSSRNITGLGSGEDGKILTIHNIGSNNLVLKDASGSSLAANQFILDIDKTVVGDSSVTVRYDGTSGGWRLFSAGGAAPCTDDDTAACELAATRSTSDAQFTAANIKSGSNILNVTGTYGPACSNDASTACTLDTTRSNSDADFVAANIKNGTNILNVTGTYAASGTAFTQMESFPAEGSTYEIQVISEGTSHTEGLWTELAAATSFDAVGFYLIISTHHSNAIDFHVDIGTGAASSETAIIQNIPVTSGCPTAGICSDMAVYIPLAIASGTRVAARIQSTSTTKSVWMSLLMAGGTSATSYTTATTYGSNAADTGGTPIDPGGSANTKGSWTEITASTSAACSAFWVFFGLATNADPANAYFKYDIGTGTGGGEVVKVSNLPTRSETTLDALHYFAHWIPFAIPTSTRIAMRGQTDTIDATDRILDATIICFN